jgi:hypothetical protein
MTPGVFPTLAIVGSTAAATALFALAMPRHHAMVTGTPPRPDRTRALRLAGGGMLLASLVIALAFWQNGVTLVLWTALLSLHAFGVTLIITYAARHLAGVLLAAILVLVAGLTGIAGLP